MQSQVLLMKKKQLEKYHKAKENAAYDIVKVYWKNRFLKNPEELMEYVASCDKEKIAKWCTKKTSSKAWMFMLTVNPKESTTFEEFDKLMRKALNKKWIRECIWCYEIRKVNEGLHGHALVQCIDKGYYVKLIKSELNNTFKRIIGNVNCVDVKFDNGNPLFEKNMLNYIKKGLKDLVITKWRNDNNILGIYGKWQEIESDVEGVEDSLTSSGESSDESEGEWEDDECDLD